MRDSLQANQERLTVTRRAVADTHRLASLR